MTFERIPPLMIVVPVLVPVGVVLVTAPTLFTKPENVSELVVVSAIVKLLVPVMPPLKATVAILPVLPIVNVPFVAKPIVLATVKPVVVPTNNDAALVPVVSPKVTVFVPKALADVTLTVPALMVVPPV